MAKKIGYLKDSIAKASGYYSVNGEKLKGATLSQAQQDEWNGVKPKAAPKPAEPEVEVSEVEESVEEPVKKNKKKKTFFSKES
jgi:hypothetical protein